MVMTSLWYSSLLGKRAIKARVDVPHLNGFTSFGYSDENTTLRMQYSDGAPYCIASVCRFSARARDASRCAALPAGEFLFAASIASRRVRSGAKAFVNVAWRSAPAPRRGYGSVTPCGVGGSCDNRGSARWPRPALSWSSCSMMRTELPTAGRGAWAWSGVPARGVVSARCCSGSPAPSPRCVCVGTRGGVSGSESPNCG